MNKLKALAVAILLIFVLTACGNSNNPAPRIPFEPTLEYAQAVAQARREGITSLQHSALNPYIRGYDQLVIASNSLIQQMGQDNYLDVMLRIFTPTGMVDSITPHQAVTDAAFLLYLMQMRYGAYIFYGGDAVFVPLFGEIFAYFQSLDAGVWDSRPEGQFAATLHDRLSSISGFRCQVLDMYIVDVEGYDINDIFMLYLSEAGEIGYIPVYVVPEGSSEVVVGLPIILDDGEMINFPLLRHISSPLPHRAYPSLEWREGIPVLSVMAMGFYPNETRAQILRSYAYSLRDEPVVILDIRSNIGGNSLLVAQLMYDLTGEVVPTSSLTLNIGDIDHSMFMHSLVPSYEPFYLPVSDINKFRPAMAFGNNHYITHYGPRRVVPNDMLLVVLVDRHTMSASETIVELALNLENTLVVGQNTAGATQKTGGQNYYLPYSGLPVSFGLGLVVHPVGMGVEGIGFAPDIWTYADALEAVLALLGGQPAMP
ncbi:MAG: S41 family peptidase [Defluviitaleaceae bacterium]|nr:S41 family peptidase [Defluviitaleaceae bacterium]